MGNNEEGPHKIIHDSVIYNLTSISRSSNNESLLSTYPDEVNHLEDILTHTLSLGESNSALIIGPPGIGKTALLNAILNKLSNDCILDDGIIVHLSGLLQNDDKLALREIAHQLQASMDYETEFKSFAESLSYILKALQSGKSNKSRPVIFILDEFQEFCHLKNQTLLYNLFDTAQSAQTPICVIGLTCRLDALSLLEKRVRSRFSHRQIFLLPQTSFENYIDITKRLLSVENFHKDIKKRVKRWNRHIEEVLEDLDVKLILKDRFSFSKDIRSLKHFLRLVMGPVTEEEPFLKKHYFKSALETVTQDFRTKILFDLSFLQLCLVIAMKHIVIIYEGEPFNFEMVYNKYKKFVAHHIGAGSYERPVVFKAFDQLECLELICPVDHIRSNVQKEYRLMQLMILPNTIDEVVSSLTYAPAYLKQWCLTSVQD